MELTTTREFRKATIYTLIIPDEEIVKVKLSQLEFETVNAGMQVASPISDKLIALRILAKGIEEVNATEEVIKKIEEVNKAIIKPQEPPNKFINEMKEKPEGEKI